MRDRSDSDKRAAAVEGSSPAQASSSPQSSRRRFLFALGATGAGAVAAATVSPGGSALASTGPASVPVDHRGSRGYRETEHVLDYYATARH